MSQRFLLFSIISFLAMAFDSNYSSANPLNLSVTNGIEGPKDPNGNRTFYFPVNGSPPCVGSTVYPYSFTDGLTNNQQTLQGLNYASDDLKFSIQAASSLSQIGGGSSVVIRVESEANPGIFYATTQPTGVGYNGGSSSDPTQQFYGTIDHQIETFGIHLSNIGSVNGYCSYLQNLNAQFANCQIPNGQSIQNATRFNIGLVPQNSPSVKGTQNTAQNTDSILINIVITNCAPSGIIPNFIATPLDSSAKITDNTITSNLTFPLPLKDTIVFGSPQINGNTPGLNAPNQQVVSSSPYIINNLINDTAYCFSIGYTNLAGFISTPKGNANPTNNCTTPSKIDGFLSKNACFIATAAYSDLDDPRLELLRQFRDEVLYPFVMGRKFIEWYYSWSPQAAHWIIDHPQYKSMIKIGLLPVLGVAKTTLWIRNNMWVLSVVMLLSIALLVAKWLWVRSDHS